MGARKKSNTAVFITCFVGIFSLFIGVTPVRAIYCQSEKKEGFKTYTLTENSKCTGIDPNLQCCYSITDYAPGADGIWRSIPFGYEVVAGASDAENPGLTVGGSLMCCPGDYQSISTYRGGAGQCAAEDLINMPPGSYNAITDCCKKISGQTLIPAGPGVPSYLLKGGVDIKKAVPCSTVNKDLQVDICSQISRSDERSRCNLCKKENGVYTAIGCIRNTGSGIVTNVARFLIGTLGGIILLIILISGFRIATSRGDVKAIQQARESLTAAISGAFLIVFSMVLLQVIGVKILQLPGF